MKRRRVRELLQQGEECAAKGPGPRKVKREYGLAHADEVAAIFGTNENLVFGIATVEGAELAETPTEIDKKIIENKRRGDGRIFTVIVEGSLAYLEKCRNELREPKCVVYCADEATLRTLGVPIIDEGWKEGDPGIALDQFVNPGGLREVQEDMKAL